MTARIVTTTYRYKPPPKRKGRKLGKITGPAVVTVKRGRRPVLGEAAAESGIGPPGVGTGGQPESTTARASGGAHIPANDDRKSAIATVKEKPPRRVPADSPKPPAIVTTSPKPRISDDPNLPTDLPASRKPVEREGDDYKRMRDAMARRLRGE